MADKLEVTAKMPAVVELSKGKVVKVTTVTSEADLKNAL